MLKLGIRNDCEIISFHNSYDTFPKEKFDALLVSIFKIEVYQSFRYYSTKKTKCAWPCKYILQSQRWLEFSKMADNIKELSTNMLSQSRSNTRKTAIRADLDEELEL